eukprot:Em0006g1100a
MDLQNLKLKEVLKCTEEVARQMTLIDHAQLCKISALELLQKVNMVPRPQSQRNSKMSSQSLQSSLSLSSLEQSETAIEKLAFRGLIRELDERVTAVHQFILIAKQCLELQLCHGSGGGWIGSAPIRRLHKTWENNYKRYRDRLSTPALPYIGVFLKDLTFICDGNPDYLRGGLINVHKRRQVYSKVEEIKRLQKNGPAVIDGNLKQGDVLLSINGTPLEGLSVSEATTVFRNSTNLAKLIVSPMPTAQTEETSENGSSTSSSSKVHATWAGFDPGVRVGIVVGAAAGVLLLVLVVIAIGCYVWKKHTLRTYRIQALWIPIANL